MFTPHLIAPRVLRPGRRRHLQLRGDDPEQRRAWGLIGWENPTSPDDYQAISDPLTELRCRATEPRRSDSLPDEHDQCRERTGGRPRPDILAQPRPPKPAVEQ